MWPLETNRRPQMNEATTRLIQELTIGRLDQRGKEELARLALEDQEVFDALLAAKMLEDILVDENTANGSASPTKSLPDSTEASTDRQFAGTDIGGRACPPR